MGTMASVVYVSQVDLYCFTDTILEAHSFGADYVAAGYLHLTVLRGERSYGNQQPYGAILSPSLIRVKVFVTGLV